MHHKFPHLILGLALLFTGIGTMTMSLASEAPSLSILPWNPMRPHEIDLAFDKPAGLQMFVEESKNLSQWTYLPRFWAGDGARESLSLPRESSGRFYRLSTYPNPEHEWVTATANSTHAGFRLFLSKKIGRPVSFHILPPTAYTNQPDRRFPVIYWLHGAGAGVAGVTPISQLYVNAMNLGLMPPVILVFANGLPYGMWCDSKNGVTPMESILINELIPHVDGSYRTIATPEGRVIEGFSMGGYGAGRLGLKFTGKFRALSMMGAGALQLDFLNDETALIPLPVRETIFANVYGNDVEYFETQSPWRQAEQSADSLPPNFAIRMIVGDADAMLTNNRALSEHFATLEIQHSYRELPGIGHDPMQILLALGPANWQFYRTIFSGTP